MGALGWTIYRPEQLVVIRGIGVFDIYFATAFREAMRAEGAAGFCKLFDLSRVDIKLSNQDMESMVASTRLGGPIRSGPIAIYLGKTPPPLLVDMAILLKDRIGHRRRIRLFTDQALARQWLAGEGPALNPPHEVFQLPSRGATKAGNVRR
ncbi:hypothetical protein [Reyranella sp.]|uniref:hypothetical protein n=1 Tax=Reyranella sp. TaxID=1929291 RepID=UPI004035D1DD